MHHWPPEATGPRGEVAAQRVVVTEVFPASGGNASAGVDLFTPAADSEA